VEGFDLPLAVPSFALRSLLFMFATAAATFIVPLPDLRSCHDFPVACISEAVMPCYSRQAAPVRTTKLGDLSPSPADVFVKGVLSGEDEQQLLCRASSWAFRLFVSIFPVSERIANQWPAIVVGDYSLDTLARATGLS
jgi:hypothetical protein